MERVSEELTLKDWLENCQFHSFENREVLEQVSGRAAQVSNPMVLLDLDSTLYEVGPRTCQILKDWATSDESSHFPVVREVIRKLNLEDVKYSVEETLSSLGLIDNTSAHSSLLSSMKAFWALRFFSNGYLAYDRPYPGALEFVKQLYEQGVEIVYMTGRDEPNMGLGTQKNLIRDGFPFGGRRTQLWMKPHDAMPDLEFKVGAVRAWKERAFLKGDASLIASFENEPRNLVSLAEQHPEAMHVFVHTVCSSDRVRPMNGLFKIAGFC